MGLGAASVRAQEDLERAIALLSSEREADATNRAIELLEGLEREQPSAQSGFYLVFAYSQAGRWEDVLARAPEVLPRIRALPDGAGSELEARLLRSQATAYAKQAQRVLESGEEAQALRLAAAGEAILARVLEGEREPTFDVRLRYELRDLRDRALRLQTQVLFGAGAFPAAEKALDLRVSGLEALIELPGLPEPARRSASARRVEAIVLRAEVARVRGDLGAARSILADGLRSEDVAALPARVAIVYHRVRGLIAEELSEFDEAERAYTAEGEAIARRAAEIAADDRDAQAALASDRANLERCLGDVARARGRLEEALAAYDRGASHLPLLAEGPAVRHRVQLDYRRGLALRELGRRDEALAALARALEGIEAVHREAPEVGAAGIYSLQETRALLEAWLELVVTDGVDPDARGLRAVEAARARGLLRELQGSSREASDPALLERVSASRAVSWKRQEPDLAAVERRELLETLFRMQVAERQEAPSSRLEPSWLERVQRHLSGGGGGALVYFSGPRALWIWTLDGETPRVTRREKPRDVLAALVRTAFRNVARAPVQGSADDAEFRQQLVAQLRAMLFPELPGKGPLWIVPDDMLNLLPWSFVLPEERAVHRIVPSFQTALTWAEKGQPAVDRSSNLLLVGGVRPEGHEGLSELLGPAPLARREIDHLAAQFGGRVYVLRGEFAREGDVRTAIQQPNFAVLHVNVHGIHDPFVPSSSGLVLEPDAGHDGFLWADEVARFERVPPLVVLNSCSTGRGELDPSEGIIGLARAFLERGALAVVANLWEVDDAAAYRFAQDFYERLKRGDDFEHAMAYGVARIRREKPHPHHWSGYVLLGDGSLRLPGNLKKPVVPEGLSTYLWAIWGGFVAFVAIVITIVVLARRRALRATGE